MTDNWIPIGPGDESFEALLVAPDNPNGQAIVLLQEIFGVNRPIRKFADWLAGEGYHVVVPDLFWRIEPHIELGYSKEEIQQAMGLLQKFDEEAAVRDIAAAVAALRERKPVAVHLLGLCLGGKLAVLGGADDKVTSAVSFYGTGLEKTPEAFRRLKCPVQLHFGSDDQFIPSEAIEAVEAEAQRIGAEVFVYEGVGHGFFNPARETADDTASQIAWGRASAFMQTATDA